MSRIFLDTSVLFSACSSQSGASARILQLCKQGKMQGYISNYIIDEVKKNVSHKLDQIGKQRLNIYLLQAHLQIIENPGTAQIQECEKVINRKDAPILAAALKSNAETLVTLNTKDFMKPAVRKFANLLKIVTPRDFIHQ